MHARSAEAANTRRGASQCLRGRQVAASDGDGSCVRALGDGHLRSDAFTSHRLGARSVVRRSLDRLSGVDQLSHGLESGRAVSDAGHKPPQLQSSLINPRSFRSSSTISAGGWSASPSRTRTTWSLRRPSKLGA